MTSAIVLREAGGPEKLLWETIDVPRARRGELRVRHTAIGVNFHDTYVRSGLYKTLPLPGTPGLEAAGTVEDVGSDVLGFAVGDRIAYIDAAYGAYSQVRTLKASLALRLPHTLSEEAAAALLLKGMTVGMLVRRVHQIVPGQVVLIHAAAGGVGQPLVRWTKHLGATVIATVGTMEKAAIARACGADHVILYREESFVDKIREITDGRGVDVAYDSVGKDTFAGSLASLGYLGRLVNFGQSSGQAEPFNVSALAAKSNTISRPMLFHYMRDRSSLESLMAEMLKVIDEGVIRADIGLRLPLREAAEAHRALEGRATTGAIVLLP